MLLICHLLALRRFLPEGVKGSKVVLGVATGLCLAAVLYKARIAMGLASKGDTWEPASYLWISNLATTCIFLRTGIVDGLDAVAMSQGGQPALAQVLLMSAGWACMQSGIASFLCGMTCRAAAPFSLTRFESEIVQQGCTCHVS